MIKKVLDISRYQGGFNPQKARRQGIDGVMLRGAYGLCEDSHFLPFAIASRKAGLAVGGYLFATWHYASVSSTFEEAKRNACLQAYAFIKILKKAPVNSFAALSLELESGQSCLLTNAQLTECANLFLDILKRKGYSPLLYCSVAWLTQRMEVKNCKYPFWIAYYYSNSISDVDFDISLPGVLPDTGWGQRMKELGPRLALWQFGYKGGGRKYGVESQNIDKNWAYLPLVSRSCKQVFLHAFHLFFSFFSNLGSDGSL